MATRSRIAYSDYDVVSVYHHWDGYPEGLGKHLVENYPTLQDAIKLVDGGDISSCMGEGDVLYYGSRSNGKMKMVISIQPITIKMNHGIK